MNPRVKALYKKIPNRRVTRLLHFGVYFSTTIAGLIATLSLPTLLVHLIGPTMVAVFGIFSIAGSVMSMAGVLPGIEWLERVGVILLLTAVTMYAVMLIYTGVTVIALWIAVALAISLVQRLIDIHRVPCDDEEV